MTWTRRWLVGFFGAALALHLVGCTGAPPAREAAREAPAPPTPRDGPDYHALWLATGPGGKLYTVMLEQLPRGASIVFRRSSDYGATAQAPTRIMTIDQSAVALSFPWMALDGKEGIYLAWRWKTPAHKRLYFSRSLDDGRTWQEPRILTDREPFAPILDVTRAGRVSVLWQDEVRATRDLNLTLSDDSGATWLENPIRLTAAHVPKGTQVFAHRLVSDQSGRIYVIWYQRGLRPLSRDLVLTRSFDLGKSWLPQPDTLRSIPDPEGPGIYNPMLVAGPGGQLFAGWEERDQKTGWRLLLKRSTDGGITWTQEPILVNTPLGTRGIARRFRLATDGKGRLYAAWTEKLDDRQRVAFRRSTDAGASWDPVRYLDGETPTHSVSETPWVVPDEDGRVFVAWQHWQGRREVGWRIFFTRSDDSGATWLPEPVRLDTLPQRTAGVRPLQLLSDGRGAVYVAWRNDPFGKRDYFLNKSTDYGTTWLPKEQWLTDPSTVHSGQAAVRRDPADGGSPRSKGKPQ